MRQIKLLAVLFLLVGKAYSQDLNIKWSQALPLKNNIDGFFVEFLEQNDKFIYAKFASRKRATQYKIVAFDKNSMKKVASVGVIGYEENKKDHKKFKKLTYYKSIIYNDNIYVFYSAYNKKKKATQYLVKSYSPNLKEMKPLTVIEQVKLPSDKHKKGESLFVLGNSETNKILICKEKEGSVGENIKLEYKVLNSDFSFSSANQTQLPYKIKESKFLWVKSVSTGASSSYTYGNDGNLHLKTNVSYSKEQIKGQKENNKKRKKKGKKKEKVEYTYTDFSVIKLATGEMKTTSLKFDKKNVKSLYRAPGETTKLFGYYSDLEKDPRGYETHGLFYCTLNSDYEIENVKFNPFTTALIKKMFKNDKSDKDGGKKAGCCLTGKKGSTHADDGTLSSNYTIEEAITGENGEVYLFTSIMINGSREVCTTDSKGNRTCRTVYYCKKKNVTVFKMNSSGTLEWGSNHDRYIEYTGRWYVYDVNVIYDDNGFYVTYGSYKSSKRKGSWLPFTKKDRSYAFEYIYVKSKDGKITVKEKAVNKASVKKKDAKIVNATNIQVINNKFMVDYSKVGLSPTGWGLYAVGGCLMPNVILRYFPQGKGYFGIMEPVSK